MAWQRVELVVAGERAQALADALEEAGALATELTDADAGTADEQAIFGEPGSDSKPWPRTRVSALFNLGFRARSALDDAIAAAGAEVLGPAAIERIEDADWVALTQRQFEPLQVGRKLWIVPTWHKPPHPEAINVILDPGAAFGTGSHPTTRLCIGWLEDQVRADDRILDYGCGSGILSICALKLGAARAVGVDIDPLAVEAARYNARQNGVPLEVFDAEHAPEMQATVTVANILANPLRVLAPVIAAHTCARGRIALSGILEEQAAAVIEAYAPWARLEVTRHDSGWVLVTGAKLPAC
ncbi:MAG TPA: 50S ribosomal protein L11 methyltransferase [Usitatibacter sp.]|jgi:ribosomal protein L11 methyltransferase|nr:50S ribosomal protein L11 methyltransferase [Usitatibacter sp.]